METKVRPAIPAVVALAAASVLVAALGGWVAGAPSTAPEELTPAGTSVYFSASEQAESSEIVASFTTGTSRHLLPSDPSTEEMAEYISEVPWEAVFAQWDCVLLSPPTAPSDRTPLMEFSYLCGDNAAGSPATDHAGLVEPAIAER